jgi:hypothetical protein
LGNNDINFQIYKRVCTLISDAGQQSFFNRSSFANNPLGMDPFSQEVKSYMT